jgi:uncharacterized membrane protein YgaE (UPF0421/DUF939 family)
VGALLTVYATVYRTFARGAQQVGATVLGVLLAFAVGNVLGVIAWSLGLMLLVAMLAGSARGLRGESTMAAATALVVLLTGYSANDHILGARLLDTVFGIGVGLLVNLVVWPPLRDRAAARRVDRIDDELGALLTDMADRLHERDDGDAVDDWVERTRDLDHDIDAAWATVRRARESGRRRRLPRALDRSAAARRRRVSDADSAAIGEIRVDLEAVAEGEHRPARGALLVNLRNILDAMDAVADAQPVRADVRHLALS